jgi:hypothetical protein
VLSGRCLAAEVNSSLLSGRETEPGPPRFSRITLDQFRRCSGRPPPAEITISLLSASGSAPEAIFYATTQGTRPS